MKGWQNVSRKAQMVNILGFAHHMVAVAAIQLCHCTMKAAVTICKHMGVPGFQ